MQEFPIRWATISDACTASLIWLWGQDETVDQLDALPGIDLGEGMALSPVEVVESHFQRLVDSCNDATATITDEPTSTEVRSSSTAFDFSVDSLRTAIGSLAPHLLPVVQVAEDLADAVPPRPPAKKFRYLLNEALVAETKQQHNKQAIGIQPASTDEYLLDKIADNKYTLIASLPVAATLAFSLWYLSRAKREELRPDLAP